jgi:hypothetical protein
MIALVIGGSTRVKEEVRRALDICKPDMVVVVNDFGIDYAGQMDHWVTLHPGLWRELLWGRRRNELSMEFERWSPPFVENVDNDREIPKITIYPDYKPSGLSGLYAVKVAVHNGADRIVLAGVPMDLSGHYSGNRKLHWINVTKRRAAWQVHYPALRQSVRSVSGWTKQLFGEPTEGWLNP